jgi:hypothetical protein
MAEGTYAVLAFPSPGALVGAGAAALLNVTCWIGLGVGASLLPGAVRRRRVNSPSMTWSAG